MRVFGSSRDGGGLAGSRPIGAGHEPEGAGDAVRLRAAGEGDLLRSDIVGGWPKRWVN